MPKNVLRITYLYNSGFLVETENHVLIFDYCLANTSDPTNQIIANALKRKSFITVFVSHGHSDHFNPLILRWRVKRRDIKYVFSDDIPALDLVIRVKSGMEIDLNDIHSESVSSYSYNSSKADDSTSELSSKESSSDSDNNILSFFLDNLVWIWIIPWLIYKLIIFVYRKIKNALSK